MLLTAIVAVIKQIRLIDVRNELGLDPMSQLLELQGPHTHSIIASCEAAPPATSALGELTRSSLGSGRPRSSAQTPSDHGTAFPKTRRVGELDRGRSRLLTGGFAREATAEGNDERRYRGSKRDAIEANRDLRVDLDARRAAPSGPIGDLNFGAAHDDSRQSIE